MGVGAWVAIHVCFDPRAWRVFHGHMGVFFKILVLRIDWDLPVGSTKILASTTKYIKYKIDAENSGVNHQIYII